MQRPPGPRRPRRSRPGCSRSPTTSRSPSQRPTPSRPCRRSAVTSPSGIGASGAARATPSSSANSARRRRPTGPRRATARPSGSTTRPRPCAPRTARPCARAAPRAPPSAGRAGSRRSVRAVTAPAAPRIASTVSTASGRRVEPQPDRGVRLRSPETSSQSSPSTRSVDLRPRRLCALGQQLARPPLAATAPHTSSGSTRKSASSAISPPVAACTARATRLHLRGGARCGRRGARTTASRPRAPR